LQAASWLLECLGMLRDAGDMPELLAAFRDFSEALLLLSNLTAKHLEELQDCPQRRSLAQTLQLLQEYVPLLHKAKHSDLKCSWEQQVALYKDITFQMTERTIQELTSLLVNKAGSEEPGDRHRTFSWHVSRLLAILSHPDPVHLSKSKLSAHVGALVFYCMLLADSSRPDLKQNLVQCCWVLLRLSKSICSHINQHEGWPGQSWGESSLEEECDTMREEVENLDQAVLTATLYQVLDTFFEGEEPLRQLVEDALSLSSIGCFPAGQGGLLKKLQPLTTTFFMHAQQMLRAVDFVLARCPQTQTARVIEEQVQYLKRLLASLPPALTEMSGHRAPASAAERLRSLYRAWSATTESLLWCFEETVGTRELLTLSVQEMAKHRERCEKALESQDPQRFSQHEAHLTSWARWVVEATTRYVDRATDPIFRNGLLVWIEQLASSILQLKAVTALFPERLSSLQTQDVFLKAARHLLDAAQHVQDGLDGSNHPDILSPLREQVRRTDVAEGLDLSPLCAGLETITDEAVSQEDTVKCPSSHPGSSHLSEGDTHPVVTALLEAVRAQDMAAVNAACSALLELSNSCIEAAKEALPLAQSPLLEMTLGQHQEITFLTLHVISLARESAPRQCHCPRRLLHAALLLSGRLRATKACLAAASGSWYRLSQQVFSFIASADFPRGKQALEETMVGLAASVQLAGDIASVAHSRGNPLSPDVWESFLQVQAKFTCAQLNTRVLLEKVASFQGSCKVGRATLELCCIHWAVSMCVLLGAVDRFIGRDVLHLTELRDAMKNKLCSWNLLAAVSENSLRLQEAARLSYLSCPENHGCREILMLREEMKVLMEALLDASSTLLVSPLSTASLDIRFELLQRDLALRAKVLLLHLEKINAEHLQVIQDVLGPALAPLSQEDRERSKEAFEEKANQLIANVQWVKATLQDILEASTQADLLSVADHLLVLTSDAVGSASQLFQSHGDKGYLHLDTIIWYWSAKANYLMTQLHTIQGISRHILQHIRRRLQNVEDQCSPGQCKSTPKLFPAQELDAPIYTKEGETCPSRSRRGCGATREAQEMVW
ncbi:CTNA1 protein, partial [Halcyon senegalensis]|nr:CTNA1 protein [Halcyon senegalensis]